MKRNSFQELLAQLYEAFYKLRFWAFVTEAHLNKFQMRRGVARMAQFALYFFKCLIEIKKVCFPLQQIPFVIQANVLHRTRFEYFFLQKAF